MEEVREEKKANRTNRRKQKPKSGIGSVLGKIFSILLAIIIVIVAITFGVTYYSTYHLNIQYRDLILKYSEENNLDPKLVTAVISIESSFNKKAESHAGAIGLMQLMPDTAKWISEKIDVDFSKSKLTDPEYNIQLGTYYLGYLIDYYNSDHLALAAYNGGMGNIDKWLESGEITPDRDAIEDIPYKEPREYVSKVEKRKELINLFYGNSGLPKDDDSTIKLAINNYFSYIKKVVEEF